MGYNSARIAETIALGLRLLSHEGLLDPRRFSILNRYFSLGLNMSDLNTNIQKSYVLTVTSPWDKAAQTISIGKNSKRGFFDASKKAQVKETHPATIISRL
jgi:hypothetical protein